MSAEASMDRFSEIAADSHIRRQIEAIMPAYTLLVGVNNASSVDDLMREVSVAIAALEQFPEIVQTHGGPLVIQRGMHSYEILLRGPHIYPLHSDKFHLDDKFHPLAPGPFVTGEPGIAERQQA